MLQRPLSPTQKTVLQLIASLLVIGLLGYVLQAIVTLTIHLVMLGGVTGLALWGSFHYVRHRVLQQTVAPPLLTLQGAERLNYYFYQLLREHQGHTTVLDFALKANLPASQAKAYLDQKAREFNADFEGTDQGNLVYRFETVETWQETAMTSSGRAIASPLNQTQLAQRLQVSPGTIRRRKQAPDFAQWSQSKDPDGLAWSYQQAEKQFVPQQR